MIRPAVSALWVAVNGEVLMAANHYVPERSDPVRAFLLGVPYPARCPEPAFGQRGQRAPRLPDQAQPCRRRKRGVRLSWVRSTTAHTPPARTDAHDMRHSA